MPTSERMNPELTVKKILQMSTWLLNNHQLEFKTGGQELVVEEEDTVVAMVVVPEDMAEDMADLTAALEHSGVASEVDLASEVALAVTVEKVDIRNYLIM